MDTLYNFDVAIKIIIIKVCFLHETVGIIFYVIFIANFTTPGLVCVWAREKGKCLAIKRTVNWSSNNKIYGFMSLPLTANRCLSLNTQEEAIDKYLKSLVSFAIKYVLYCIETIVSERTWLSCIRWLDNVFICCSFMHDKHGKEKKVYERAKGPRLWNV